MNYITPRVVFTRPFTPRPQLTVATVEAKACGGAAELS